MEVCTEGPSHQAEGITPETPSKDHASRETHSPKIMFKGVRLQDRYNYMEAHLCRD